MNARLPCTEGLTPFYGVTCASVELLHEPGCFNDADEPCQAADFDAWSGVDFGHGVVRRPGEDGGYYCLDADTGERVECP